MSDDNADPIKQWVIVSKDLMAAYGVFRSEAAALEWAKADRMNLDQIETVPMHSAFMQLDVEAFHRRLKEDKS